VNGHAGPQEKKKGKLANHSSVTRKTCETGGKQEGGTANLQKKEESEHYIPRGSGRKEGEEDRGGGGKSFMPREKKHKNT